MEDRRRRRKTSDESNSEGSDGEEDAPVVAEKKEEEVSESVPCGDTAATVIENDGMDDECEYETETYDDETESYDEDETTEAGTELTEDEHGELAEEEVGLEGQQEWLEERQRGDGQEQPAAESENVDDDEDRKNPAYIPRRGAFYEHDSRFGEEEEGGERQEAEPEEVDEAGDAVKSSKKQLWTESKKWDHDRYTEDQQKPKSRDEIISIYGYDIRAHSEPPEASPVRSSRGRRGGGSGRPDRRSQRLQDFIPQNEHKNGRPSYESMRSRDDQEVEYDQGGRGYRPRGSPRGRGPPSRQQQQQQRGGRPRQNDTPPRNRSSKPTMIIESDSYIDEDMIPPMTTPYSPSPTAQPIQSTADVDRPKDRTSGKPMAPGGYSQEDLLNIMPPTTTNPTSSRSSITHAKRYSSQRQRNPPEQNVPQQEHQEHGPPPPGHHNGNRNHQPQAHFYNSVYHHQRYPMSGPPHPSSRGMSPRGSSPRGPPPRNNGPPHNGPMRNMSPQGRGGSMRGGPRPQGHVPKGPRQQQPPRMYPPPHHSPRHSYGPPSLIRGPPPMASLPYNIPVSTQPASFTPPLTSVTMASHPVLHPPFIGPPAVMNYGHPGTVPTTATSAPFPLATMPPMQAPLPSNAQAPDGGIHVRGGTTYFNPEAQPNVLTQTNQEGIEVRGGTTYFNPESQAFTPAPLVVPVPQNKRPKVAIPIVNPLPSQRGHQQYDFDPEAPEYLPEDYYDTDPEVGSWCEGEEDEREGSKTPVNEAELAQGLSDIQINSGPNGTPTPVEPT